LKPLIVGGGEVTEVCHLSVRIIDRKKAGGAFIVYWTQSGGIIHIMINETA
jgi:hypothetical protein